MPSSLIFDRIKIQSILLHLLMDLHQFVNHDNDIKVDISFVDKFLQIELSGVIHQKNTLFKTMFQQTKLAMDNKDRVGLQLSRKLIERLKGKLDFSYENAYYKFILTIPVQVIKL
jgi:sensor histidine kinase regulating citrate/malate metabolism